MQYASLGLQMVATVGIFVYIGHKIDGWQQTQRPWFTLLFSIFGIAAAIYQLFRAFTGGKR